MEIKLNHKKEFISRYKRNLLGKISEAEEGVRDPYKGSGFICTPKEFFESVVLGEDYELLPFVLLYIYHGDCIKRDAEFALSALEELWDTQELTCPTTAYVYAYCLNYEERYDESLSILTKLDKNDYLPAIATLADLDLGHNKKNEAQNGYEYLVSKGYLPIWSRYLHLKHANSNGFFKKIHKTINRIRFKLMFVFSGIRTKGRGDKVTYLDFYSLRFDKKGQLIQYSNEQNPIEDI